LGHSCFLADAATLPIFTAATPQRRHHQTSRRHAFSKIPISTAARISKNYQTPLRHPSLSKLPNSTAAPFFQNYQLHGGTPSFSKIAHLHDGTQNYQSPRSHTPTAMFRFTFMMPSSLSSASITPIH
jgi:hypothetical protein